MKLNSPCTVSQKSIQTSSFKENNKLSSLFDFFAFWNLQFYKKFQKGSTFQTKLTNWLIDFVEEILFKFSFDIHPDLSLTRMTLSNSAFLELWRWKLQVSTVHLYNLFFVINFTSKRKEKIKIKHNIWELTADTIITFHHPHHSKLFKYTRVDLYSRWDVWLESSPQSPSHFCIDKHKVNLGHYSPPLSPIGLRDVFLV